MFAALLDQRLNGTGWTAQQLANFLYNGPPEDRPPGTPPYDWRDVYNATTQILKLLSTFLGVCDHSFIYLFQVEKTLVFYSLNFDIFDKVNCHIHRKISRIIASTIIMQKQKL